jgi:glycosyltransferase involved in cell wall biosynthesis
MLKALKDLGHEPTCFCFYGLSGGSINYDGYECLPNSDFETWGNDVVKVHTERCGARAIITLIDLFVLNPQIWEYPNREVPWLAWVPIDCQDMGEETYIRLKLIDMPVAMSEFGRTQMLERDIESAMIYHAVDTDVFTPGDGGEWRKMSGIPEDVFLVGMVMANKGDRKQYPLHLEAIKQFSEKNPDLDVRAYIHTEPTSMMGGWDMKSLAAKLGLTGKVYATNQYDTSVVPLSPERMAMMYRSFNVLMNCSAGEGFGIPIVEAQACGVPVVTHGVTAMPEITVNGYTVESATRGLASHYGWQFTPSVEDMVYRLDCVYRMSDSKSAAIGREWVESYCSVPVVAAQWDALLRGLEHDLQGDREESRVTIG